MMFTTQQSGLRPAVLTPTGRSVSHDGHAPVRQRAGRTVVAAILVMAAAACSRPADIDEIWMSPPLIGEERPEQSTGARERGTEERGEVADEPSGPVDGSSAGSGDGGTTETPDGGTEATAGPDLPDDVKGYAEAVLAAVEQWDLDRLFELTTPLAAEKLMKLPDQPLWEWTWIRCYTVDGCSFYNEDGDHMTLFIDPNQLGQPNAANDIAFTTTTYHEGALDYVEEFIQAWHAGNIARMELLAVPEAVAVYQQLEPGPLFSHGITGGSQGGLTIVSATTPGTEVAIHVGNVLLGGPQAIIGAYPEI